MEPIDYARGDRRSERQPPRKDEPYDTVYEQGPIGRTVEWVLEILWWVGWWLPSQAVRWLFHAVTPW